MLIHVSRITAWTRTAEGVAQGYDWYQMAAVSPDSLAGHPAAAGARHPGCDNPLFYEEANYAASAAFQRLSGDEDVFWDALAARGTRGCFPVLGEDFDFDDDEDAPPPAAAFRMLPEQRPWPYVT